MRLLFISISMMLPPSAVRGMKVLNKELFRKTVTVPAIQVTRDGINSLIRELKKHTINTCVGVKKVVDITGIEEGKNQVRAILLNPDYNLSPSEEKCLTENNVTLIEREVQLEFDHWDVRTILTAILPEGCEVISSFETAGHIAHVNLRDHHLPYKHVIGQVILERLIPIKTVVNKLGTIENKYRVFDMEVIAGDKEASVVTVKEHYCTYRLDYFKAFWNSRLTGERERIVKLFKPKEVILDVFAGVGPFSILACKRKCYAHANDLNPSCYQWLCENMKINKVDAKMKAYNMDAREFIEKATKELIQGEITGEGSGNLLKSMYSHVIMNLPGTAVEFLNSFIGLFTSVPEDKRPGFKLPTVHCYSFANENDPKEEVKRRVEGILMAKLSNCEISYVRNVSTNKEQFRVSFQLPSEVAYRVPQAMAVQSDQQQKRAKLEPTANNLQ